MTNPSSPTTTPANNSASLNAYTIDGDVFKVIINNEGQYSLWPEKKTTPLGWRESGFSGSKAEATAFVDAEWKDMRPLSLQKAMAVNK